MKKQINSLLKHYWFWKCTALVMWYMEFKKGWFPFRNAPDPVVRFWAMVDIQDVPSDNEDALNLVIEAKKEWNTRRVKRRYDASIKTEGLNNTTN